MTTFIDGLMGFGLCLFFLLHSGEGLPIHQTSSPEITSYTVTESESTTMDSTTLSQTEPFESTTIESTTLSLSDALESTTIEPITKLAFETIESETLDSTTVDLTPPESRTLKPSSFESIAFTLRTPEHLEEVTSKTNETPVSRPDESIFTAMATAAAAPNPSMHLQGSGAMDSSRLYNLYTFLIQAAVTLSTDEKDLYDEYEIDRFNNSDIMLPPLPMFRVDGLPDLTDLTIEKRLSMTEEALLTMHRRNLYGYKFALEEVQIDEAQQESYPRDFRPDLKIIEDETLFVLERLDIVMTELHYPEVPEDSIPPVVFEPEDSEAMRNLRDLYILQEMFHYLIIFVQQDLPRLQESHAPVEPKPTASSPNPPTVRIPDMNDMYRCLVDEATATHQFERAVYLEYKEDRFDGYDIEPRLDIEGLPDISKLSATIRYHMTVEQLLTTHRTNLYSYKQAMVFVIADEVISNSPNDFTVRFRSIQSMLTQVIEKQERLMSGVGIVIDNPSPQQMVFIEPQGSEVIRNLQDFHILQEINRYLPMILQDIDRLQVGRVGFDE